MMIRIPLYGPAAVKSSGGGGFCGCLGGGAPPLEMDEVDPQAHTPGAKGAGGTKILYDPFLNAFEGIQGWSEQGSLEVSIVYYYEARGRERSGENPLNDGRADLGLQRRGSETEERERPSVMKKSKSRGPRGRSEAEGLSPSFKMTSIEGITYKQYLESVLLHPFDFSPPSSPAGVSMAPAVSINTSNSSDYGADVLPNAMFRALASSLFVAYRSGALSRLEPFYSQSPESSPRGLKSEYASPLSPGFSAGIDSNLLSSILAISPHKSVAELIEDPRAKLPFGSGLTLLIKFAKLYRIRPETQRLVILQYMLLYYDPVSLDTMVYFRSVWEPCLFANISGSLTSDEVYGLRAVMGLFLTKAVPALNNHYALYSHSDGVEAFSLLIEMVGWSLTWNPEAEPPVSSLQETLTRAVKSRLISDLKVGGNNLHEAILSATEEIKVATEDLRRDISIQEELPGLEGFLMSNTHLRYNILTDHLEVRNNQQIMLSV